MRDPSTAPVEPADADRVAASDALEAALDEQTGLSPWQAAVDSVATAIAEARAAGYAAGLEANHDDAHAAGYAEGAAER